MHRLTPVCASTQGELRWRSVSTYVAAWMASGLLAAGVCSAFIASSPLMRLLVHRAGFVFLCLLVMQLGAAVAITAMIGRLSTRQAVALFLGYSVLNGLSLTGVFLAVTHVSPTAAFLIAAAAFALLSAYGMLTKHDLTGVDALVLMGIAGVSLITVVHGILHSPASAWIFSSIGIALCISVIAADAQEVKHMDVRADDLRTSRLAILGALVLYVDFLLGIARLTRAVVLLYARNFERQYPYDMYFPLGMH